MTQAEKWADFDKRMTALEEKIKDMEKDFIAYSDSQKSFNETVILTFQTLKK